MVAGEEGLHAEEIAIEQRREDELVEGDFGGEGERGGERGVVEAAAEEEEPAEERSVGREGGRAGGQRCRALLACCLALPWPHRDAITRGPGVEKRQHTCARWGSRAARLDSPVVIRDGAAAADRDVAEGPERVVGVAADGLRAQVAGGVDDQGAGELDDVGSFALGAVEGVEGFGEGAEALPEREVGGDGGGWRGRCWLAGWGWGWGWCLGGSGSGRWWRGVFGVVGC